MSREYDGRTTTFSPEGRLYQVEYAMEAINNAACAIGVLTKEGVVFGIEKKMISKLLAKVGDSEKVYPIDDHIMCAIAGLTSDANILLQNARKDAQDYLYKYGQPKPVEELVEYICRVKHSYTQVGGLRPFGVSFLFAGWDKESGYQLYHSDPSGNYSGWRAHAIGSNSTLARDMLKKEFKEDMTLEEAMILEARILFKTMDVNELSTDRMEFSVLYRMDNGKIKQHVLTKEETQALFDKIPKDSLRKE
ncbi:proteasome subunit [Blastocystis sp. ATCC 50177/Nand II]|uniref:Proteasome subunit alpha type n=1 Tax=Blastocystis sp. subtype 1 (strain ATCC 50177 / NandII) TaxID=478820 RepID=A0A196SG02_BLAHN|nr:proteasome subunit [Blastocystis sp. ATCC 50177/Nand II]